MGVITTGINNSTNCETTSFPFLPISSQVSQRRQRKPDTTKSSSSNNGDKPVVDTTDNQSQSRTRPSEFCYKCNIRIIPEDVTTFAICRACDQTVCRNKLCSDWDRTTGYWECVGCISNRDGQVRAGEWILDQLNRRFKTPSNADGETAPSHRDVETRKLVTS